MGHYSGVVTYIWGAYIWDVNWVTYLGGIYLGGMGGGDCGIAGLY